MASEYDLIDTRSEEDEEYIQYDMLLTIRFHVEGDSRTLNNGDLVILNSEEFVLSIKAIVLANRVLSHGTACPPVFST